MKIKIRLFASLRERFGATALERELPAGTTVGEVMAALRAEAGDPPLPTTLHMAVNQHYVELDRTLVEGDEVAVLPPVSGGGGEKRRFWITEEPLSLDAVADLVTAPDRGAIVLFSGTVRGVTGALETDHLEYEAYAGMAEQILAQIGDEIQEKWPQVLDVAIVHRLGRLEVTESSVIVAVATAHRQGVFDACAYAIERLKQIAPIWKKEVGPGGDFWVEGPRGGDDSAAEG